MIQRPLSILALAMSVALPLSVSTPVAAQTHAYRTAPVIQTMGVDQVRAVNPGSELAFKLTGTPGAEVTVQIAGATGDVHMNEVRPGFYEGRYTVRSRDRLTALSPVTASLVKDGQVARASMQQSLVLGARDVPAAFDRITAFDVDAPRRPRPGDELDFRLTGVPGGKSHAVVQGVSREIPLNEVRPGVYEGHYVLRRDDRIRGDLVADGYLKSNRVETSQRYEQSVAADRHDDRRAEHRDDRRDERGVAIACATCGRVESVNLVETKGDSPNVIGTIAGGVLGGVIGNQVGGGTGRDVARVLGAVGGAYAGNRIENNMDKKNVYRVLVRLDDGTTQTFDYAEDPAVTAGTRVKVENGVLVRQ